MFGKSVFVLVLVFCTIPSFNSLNIPESRALDDIIHQIDEIISKIKSIILDLPNFITNLISDLRNKIKEAIESIDIPSIINGIEDKIEAILMAAGIDISVARNCIDAEKVSVAELVNEVLEKIEKCRQNAEESAKQLEEELKNLNTNALSLLKEVTEGVAKCFIDYPLNPFKQAKCLTALLIDTTKKANALMLQVAQTIVTATKTAADISLNAVKCTASINKYIISGQLQIIDNFETCVDNINQ